MASQFSFSEASVYAPDCGRNLYEVSKKENIKISEDACWGLLEACLLKLPVKKVYDLLDQLYGSRDLCFPEGCEFVVESIRGRSVNKGIVYYFVKWEGWPPIFNTWEPESNLNGCKEAIRNFMDACGAEVGMLPTETQTSKRAQITEVMDRLMEAVPCSTLSALDLLMKFTDLLQQSTGSPRPYKPPGLFRLETQISYDPTGTTLCAVPLKRSASESDFTSVSCKRIRLSQKDKQTLTSALQVFQQKLNSVYPDEAPITVENNVDTECPPVDFQPIPDYRPGPGVFLPTKSPVGCECTIPAPESSSHPPPSGTATSGPLEPCWENRRKGCCAARAGACVPYNRQKRLVAPTGHPVYECNSTCPCGPSCPFRVVQLGRKVPLCVFRTRDRGWGVKTKAPIATGTFVAEYLGEILTFEEAEQRGVIYDKQTMTYLFDLDFEGDAHYTVDASQMGNISHFFNHSCDPNLTVRCVFVECLNTKLPRIALFAARFIKKDEELTFDYNMTGAIQSEEGLNPEPGSTEPLEITDSLANGTEKKSSPPSTISIELTADTASEASADTRSLSSKGPRMKCLCRSKNCRGYLVA
ncbi:Histone-lysine N-methyltransferase suv39h2 [Clonorchis sinensis]|uniref:Histone-lysine N-methyltransferase n=2 Tax=Clonorchis sinensis TaxID=79923 RepID=A0A8T1MU32_CLOSI|nr:Histone-lysine N-methyltransferase suv39h2 [Clonorchis sinensis]